MVNPQSAMGVLIAVVCAAGLWHHRWFYENTRKGRRLAHWFGEEGGLRALRILFVVGMVFGVLLAADVIRPIQWHKL